MILNRSGLFAVLLLIGGCSSGSHLSKPPVPPTPGPNLTKVVGEWNVVATASNEGHTGHLSLKEDGTFKSDYSMPASADGKQPASMESIAGIYVLGEEGTGDQKVIKVGLSVQSYNGQATSSQGDLILKYQAKGNLLRDSMDVVYARPGEEEKVKKAIEVKK